MLKPSVNEQDQQLGTNKDIVLVEFGDYQCPHCGHAYPLLKKLVQEFPSEMTFVFRNFPLAEAHPLATMAALAAEAAGKQGKFWEMHDLIYEHQQKMSGRIFLQFADQLQLDERSFADDWKNKDTMAKVEGDFESGVRSGVNGTPTFFLNGIKLESYDGTYESLKDAILSNKK